MTRRLSNLGWFVTTAAVVSGIACSAVHTIGDTSGSGGASGAASGGASTLPGTGGATATGGNAGLGGTTLPATTATGGNSGMGGMTATGGNSGMGGMTLPATTSPAPCTGTLDAVGKQFLDCPATLCGAQSLANSCGAGIISTTIGQCGKCSLADLSNCYSYFTFELGSHSTTCYYRAIDPSSSYQKKTGLIGAKVVDDSLSFCNRTSFTITGGDVPATCVDSAPKRTSCYDRDAGLIIGVSPDAGSTAAPATNCYNSFMNTCTACCPSDHDCSNKPDGYPGYSCTPDNDSYCGCSCRAGQWLCLC